MIDFELPRSGKKPSYKPALAASPRLEDRLAPTMIQYGADFQFLAQDNTYQQVGVAFQWDVNSMQCMSAVQTAGQYTTGTSNAIQAWQAMYDNGDGTLSIMGEQSIEGLTPDNGESNWNAINNIALSQNFDYTSQFDLSGVTIDASVVDDQSAYARAKVLKTTAVNALQENLAILQGIQAQYAAGNTITATCQALWYNSVLQHNQAIAARAQQELKLIKAKYGSAVFKSAVFK